MDLILYDWQILSYNNENIFELNSSIEKLDFHILLVPIISVSFFGTTIMFN